MTLLSSFNVRSRAIDQISPPCWATAKLISQRIVARIAFAVAVLFLMHLLSPDALTAPPRRGRSSGAAAAAAKKKQAIQTIQNQVAVARKVLTTAESQATMSGEQLNAVRDRLTAARSKMEAANSEERQAREALRRIEAKIISEQGPESSLGKAQASIDEAQQALDRELHRLVSLPEHEAEATAADRSADARLLSAKDKHTLRNDAQYQSVLGRLESAKRKHAEIRKDLLERSPEWLAASQTVAETHVKENKLEQDANRSAVPAASAKRTLRTSQEVAAAARATIAQGEAMLRQLGVKNVGGTSQPKK